MGKQVSSCFAVFPWCFSPTAGDRAGWDLPFVGCGDEFPGLPTLQVQAQTHTRHQGPDLSPCATRVTWHPWVTPSTAPTLFLGSCLFLIL